MSLRTILGSYYHHHHFSDGEIKAQINPKILLKSTSHNTGGAGFLIPTVRMDSPGSLL